jgi:hypothetical protein
LSRDEKRVDRGTSDFMSANAYPPIGRIDFGQPRDTEVDCMTRQSREKHETNGSWSGSWKFWKFDMDMPRLCGNKMISIDIRSNPSTRSVIVPIFLFQSYLPSFHTVPCLKYQPSPQLTLQHIRPRETCGLSYTEKVLAQMLMLKHLSDLPLQSTTPRST